MSKKKNKAKDRQAELENAQKFIAKYGKTNKEGAAGAQRRIDEILKEGSGKLPEAGPAKTDAETKADAESKAITSLYGNGIEAGRGLINELGLKDQFLGRVGENVPSQQEYLDKLKAGLDGYTSAEYQGQREQMQQGLNSQYATAQSQLAKAQARGKVYGAAGAAQQANLSQANMNSKNDLEQKLMVQNINEKQNRLNNYGQADAGYQADVLGRQKYNQGNNASEIAARSEALTGTAASFLQKRQQDEDRKLKKQSIEALDN
jgi:hypothetical protein